MKNVVKLKKKKCEFELVHTESKEHETSFSQNSILND